MEEILVGRASH